MSCMPKCLATTHQKCTINVHVHIHVTMSKVQKKFWQMEGTKTQLSVQLGKLVLSIQLSNSHRLGCTFYTGITVGLVSTVCSIGTSYDKSSPLTLTAYFSWDLQWRRCGLYHDHSKHTGVLSHG